MLFCFCSLSCARQCAVWQSNNTFWAREQQDGYRSQQASAAHQSCIVWPCNTLISSVSASLSFSVSHIWRRSSEGRAFVPGSLFVLVLVRFTTQAYIKQQPMSSCFHIQAHTNTYMLARRYCICLKMHKNKSLFLPPFIFAVWRCACDSKAFPRPWCLSGLGGSDKGNRWGLKRRWGGQTEMGSKEQGGTEGERDRGTERKNKGECRKQQGKVG